MGLESFYLAVKTAIFSSRGSAPHTPLCGWGPPPDPRVRSQRPQNLELGQNLELVIGRSHRCPSDLEKKDDLKTKINYLRKKKKKKRKKERKKQRKAYLSQTPSGRD
jgi:hypothetical protein